MKENSNMITMKVVFVDKNLQTIHESYEALFSQVMNTPDYSSTAP